MNNYHLNKIKHHFTNNSLADVTGVVSMELIKLQPLIKPGTRIAVAVGSRGIKNLVPVIKVVVEFIKENDAYPFIIPAMGSHGGAIAAGQAEILSGYGISEKTVGAPVISSMEIVELAHGDYGMPVFMDKNAYESDGIILINRIKPHTDYHSKYESGLVKMTVIGLGKDKQALEIHKYGVHGLSSLIPEAAKQIFSTGKILGGVALVENAYDETLLIKVLKTEHFLEEEPALLDIARKNMPYLPVNDIDVLIIDQMGKDMSGVGVDPNIIGRRKIYGQEEPDKPAIKAIVLLDLTEGSHGNAIGMGLSDVITRKLYDKIDLATTYTNAVTSSFLERAKIPVVANSDREAFEIAMRSCGYIKKDEEKIIRIKDTLHLDEMYVSQAVFNSIKGYPEIELLEEGINLFSSENECNPF